MTGASAGSTNALLLALASCRPSVERPEDSPFYTRSMVETSLQGERIAMMHESYSGSRFSSPVVKLMLPVRMPRRA